METEGHYFCLRSNVQECRASNTKAAVKFYFSKPWTLRTQWNIENSTLYSDSLSRYTLFKKKKNWDIKNGSF